MSELLEVSGIEVRYGAIPALRDASLTVSPGEIVAVVGPNGAGKTTLLRAISGLSVPTAGTILFDSQDITHQPAEKRVRAGLSLVPQGRRVFSESTVEMNLWAGGFSRKDTTAVAEDIEHQLQFFPALQARRQADAGMLSGGEQQMLALARALMSRPRVLLLDEPSMGLAPIVVSQIFNALATMAKDGVTMLLVEQNVARALEIADRVYVLVAGEMVARDLSKDEIDLDELTTTFLGLSKQA